MSKWKKLFLLLSFICALGVVPARALDDSKLVLSRRDTQLHLGLSFAGSFAATQFLEWQGYPTWKATLLGSLLMGVGGVVKEFANDKAASGNDLMADGIGIALNGGLQFTIRF